MKRRRTMTIIRGCLRVGMVRTRIPQRADTPEEDHHNEGKNRPVKNISQKHWRTAISTMIRSMINNKINNSAEDPEDRTIDSRHLSDSKMTAMTNSTRYRTWLVEAAAKMATPTTAIKTSSTSRTTDDERASMQPFKELEKLQQKG